MITALLLSACEVPIDSYCTEQGRAACEQGQRCGLVSRAVDCSKRSPETDCLGLNRFGVRFGVFTYDAAEAYRCVQATRTRSCGDLQAPQACTNMVTGSAQEGEPCGGCAKGLRCAREGTGTLCGTCKPIPPPPELVGVGQACVPQGVRGPNCVPGLGCVGKVCGALQPVGASCIEGHVCDFGLRCSQDRCARVPDLGEECGAETGCLGGLRCLEGRCALIAEIGGSCRHATECQTDICVEGTCRPRQARGEPCDDQLFCGDQLECLAGVCTPLPVGGDACPRYRCAAPSQCVSGLCLNPLVECR